MVKIAPNLLNNPNYTYDISEGVRWLDEPLPQEQIDEINRRALEEIERHDPRKQNYFMRLDTKSIIKTEKEYNWCLANQIPFKIVTYESAKTVLMQEDARKKQKQKKKQKRKAAKNTRKRNRS
jgi:hypothetical protein